MRKLVGISFVFVLTLSAARGEDFLQFRGPGGQGASSETGLPVTWDDTRNIVWRTELPGFGASSPISLGDDLFVTCYSGYGVSRDGSENMDDLRLHVVRVNREAGDIIWNKVIQPALPESERVRDHGYAAATPVTDGESLYVFFGKSGLFAFDFDGNQKWRAEVGSRTHGWGSGTSPVLFENLVIVNASVESGDLVAVNNETGREVWRAPGMLESWSTPHLVQLADGSHELVVSVEDKILGFDPATGAELWTCDGIQSYVCPSIISQDGIVYALGGRRSRAIAVRAGGRGDVTESHRLWVAEAGSNVSSPVIHEGYLYWVSDRNKMAYCVNLQDGEVAYSKRFGGQPYASTLLADGKLYVVTRYDGTFVLAAKPEFEQLAHNTLDDDSTFNASPIVSHGKLILRSDRFLYCIGEG